MRAGCYEIPDVLIVGILVVDFMAIQFAINFVLSSNDAISVLCVKNHSGRSVHVGHVAIN